MHLTNNSNKQPIGDCRTFSILERLNSTRGGWPTGGRVTALLLVLGLISLAEAAWAQAPGLAWGTNLGARVFSVDAQTNVYANAGGTVFKLTSDGTPLQTNAICPLPGVAKRDDAGNYYFAGSFDGTQNFGGITLVGGSTNFFHDYQWTPGAPTVFLAKYAANGNLQWVVSFGVQGIPNTLTDLALDPSGGCYVGYEVEDDVYVFFTGMVTHVSETGLVDWTWAQPVVQSRGYALRLGGATSTNCAILALDELPITMPMFLDRAGNSTYLGMTPLGFDSPLCTNMVPVRDDLGNLFNIGWGLTTNGQYLVKCAAGATLWTRQVVADARWTVGRDPAGHIYLAGTNGMLAQYGNSGDQIWSNNFASPCVAMVVDASGNRFVSLAGGTVGRLQADNPPQPPGITSAPTDQTVFAGDNVVLTVTATGTAPLAYAWRLNGTNLPGATGTQWVLNPVTASQSGSYSVVVTNLGGSITSTPALVRVKSVQLYAGSQMLTNGTYVFAAPPTLTIRSAFAGGSAFYTLDGSAPTFASTLYSKPFTVSSSAPVRALGYSADFLQSEAADPVNVVIQATHSLTAGTLGGGMLTTNLSTVETNCLALPAGAVASWRANDDATDFVGGHNGTPYRGADYADGLVGRAFQLTNDGAYIWVPDAPALRFTTAMTIEVWVNPAYLDGGADIVTKWPCSAVNTCSYRLRQRFNGVAVFEASPDGQGQNGTTTTCPTCVGATPVPVKTWTHLAATYDGAYLRLYVNGVLDGQTLFSAGSIYQSENGLGIGTSVGTHPPSWRPSNVFNGLIDEPTLYARALSSAEILAICQAGAAGKCSTTDPWASFCGGVYVATNVVSVSAIPWPGYTFLYWMGDVTGTNPTVTIPMDRDKSIQAVFGTTLSTTTAGNGQVVLDPPGGVYPYGSTVRVTGVPQPGNYFGFWGNAAFGDANPLYFTVNSPHPTISSIFGSLPSGQAALTVLINGAGRVSVSPRANAYSTTQSVSLTATPDSGQEFIGWSGDAAGSQNPLSLSMAQSRTVTANFSTRPTLLDGNLVSPAEFRFTLRSGAQTTWQILTSSNLLNWDRLMIVTNTTGDLQVIDPGVNGKPVRFYKAVSSD